MQKILLCIFLLMFSLNSEASSLYPLANKQEEQRFDNLLKKLRCLVCQNQDLADSNASLAKDLRAQVYNLLKQGKQDPEVINYLTERYGDFIVFEPPVSNLTLLLWYGPFMFLLLGFGFLMRICFKRNC